MNVIIQLNIDNYKPKIHSKQPSCTNLIIKKSCSMLMASHISQFMNIFILEII